MQFGSLSHLSGKALRALLRETCARHRTLTAELLHVLAEADWRRLWAEDGYPSMYAWCMAEYGFSEDMAARRICAARAARRHPEILEMVADGRLQLSGIVVLAPKLKETPARAAELLGAAARRSRRAIEQLLAERFPQPDVPTTVTALPAPARVEVPGTCAPAPAESPQPVPAPARVEVPGTCAPTPAESSHPAPAPARVLPVPAYSQVAPLAPQRYAVQFTMDEAMHADLVRVQELLGPQADDDRVRAVFRRALRDLVTTLEKRKYAASDRPRPQRGRRANGEQTRAQVKREVRERDGNRCTWVTEDGRRCEARAHLQLDHIKPLGKGGGWTTDNVRLLCPAHNQLAAELEYGEGFMHGIRERNRRATEAWHERRVGAASTTVVQGTAPPAPG